MMGLLKILLKLKNKNKKFFILVLSVIFIVLGIFKRQYIDIRNISSLLCLGCIGIN